MAVGNTPAAQLKAVGQPSLIYSNLIGNQSGEKNKMYIIRFATHKKC